MDRKSTDHRKVWLTPGAAVNRRFWAVSASKTLGGNGSFEIAAKSPFDMGRRCFTVLSAGGLQPGFEVDLDDAIPHRPFGTAALVALGSRRGDAAIFISRQEPQRRSAPARQPQAAASVRLPGNERNGFAVALVTRPCGLRPDAVSVALSDLARDYPCQVLRLASIRVGPQRHPPDD